MNNEWCPIASAPHNKPIMGRTVDGDEMEIEWTDGDLIPVYGEDWSRYPRRVNLLIAKARNGPTDNCQLLFQKSCTNFMDYTAWLKEHGQMEPAKGEGRGSMPSNQELGIE